MEKPEGAFPRTDHSEKRWLEVQRQRRESQNREQTDLAADIVPDLDFFFIFVSDVVHRIVTLRLEEEMTNLAASHRHHPSGYRRYRRIPEQQEIHENEARRAEQMKGLVY